ncbi:helix-turn-helix domain-containing protein [Candidatus Poribacteria bacterium]
MQRNPIDNSSESSYHSGIPGLKDGKESVAELEKLLTVQDISSLLRVPKSYVYWLTHQKKIPHMKINGHLRFRQSDIDKWLNDKEIREDVGLQEKLQART